MSPSPHYGPIGYDKNRRAIARHGGEGIGLAVRQGREAACRRLGLDHVVSDVEAERGPAPPMAIHRRLRRSIPG